MLSIWLALLIPVIVAIIVKVLFHKQVLFWEVLFPVVAVLIMITIAKFTIEMVQTDDVEYRSSLVKKARYTEYWETWVPKTCSRTVCSGSGKTRSCTTVYYDCSYCDENQPTWRVYDELGNSFGISQKYYNTLKARWNSNPQFVELNRSINNSHGCGQDGDAYDIFWDGIDIHSETAVTTHHYENRTQSAHTAFKFLDISQSAADSLGLYHYSDIIKPLDACNEYIQRSILGIEKIESNPNVVRWVNKKMEYLNGKCGPRNQVKVWVLLFPDKPIDIAFQQESYWDGGNDNELVVCIGLDSKTRKLDWVKAFSWTKHKRVMVNMREDLMEKGVYDTKFLMETLEKNIISDWEPRDFKEFNYLTVEPSTTAIVWVYILTIIITIGTSYWVVKNDIE